MAMLWAWLLPPAPFNLYGTSTLIILGFIIKGLPLGTRTLQSAFMQLGQAFAPEWTGVKKGFPPRKAPASIETAIGDMTSDKA
ncbi:MAG: hypothetical protein Q8P48_10395 [Deltaproteobacteria bacterium]|nr:hypothetical protein [Deltaproteobacteria bacterium]